MRIIFCFIFIIFFQSFSFALNSAPQVPIVSTPDKIYEKLGQKIDLNLSFINQEGKAQTLRDLLKNKTVLILTLNYYRCTTMCTYQLLNLAEALKKLNIPLGKGYVVATISFDPTDNTANAKQIRDIWLPKTGNPNAAWNFFVGDVKNIVSLTKQFNFYYEKDDEGNYSHAAALFFIRPDGTFYRYLYGIVYDKSEIEYALLETSQGALGTLWDKFLGLFYKYDPIRGRYNFFLNQ